MLSVLLNGFLSANLIRLWKEMHCHYQWCSFYHSYSCGEVHLELQNRWSHSQPWWYASLRYLFKFNCAITSTRIRNHVSEGKPRWRCPSSAALLSNATGVYQIMECLWTISPLVDLNMLVLLSIIKRLLSVPDAKHNFDGLC